MGQRRELVCSDEDVGAQHSDDDEEDDVDEQGELVRLTVCVEV